jgi:hypothetical protein
VYIVIQQDGDQPLKRRQDRKQPRRRAWIKKERRGFPRRSGKNSQNAFAHQRKEIQMLRNHATFNIGNVSRFVNGLVASAMVAMIGATYLAALGRIVLV